MKSSLPEVDRHDEYVTLWDDYSPREIPPAGRQVWPLKNKL
jgi:hypothetical protein